MIQVWTRGFLLRQKENSMYRAPGTSRPDSPRGTHRHRRPRKNLWGDESPDTHRQTRVVPVQPHYPKPSLLGSRHSGTLFPFRDRRTHPPVRPHCPKTRPSGPLVTSTPCLRTTPSILSEESTVLFVSPRRRTRRLVSCPDGRHPTPQ